MNKPQIVTDYVFPRSVEELEFGPCCRTGVLLEGTAGWRTLRPVVHHDACVKCGTCWTICPDGVIDRDINIDYNFCKGCGLCAHECPKKAIEMVLEVGEDA